MSAFSQFNGPMGAGGPSARDIVQLIAAYNELSVKLNAHLNELATAEGSSVHAIKAYVDSVKNTLETLINTKASGSKLGNGELNKIDAQTPANAIDAINKLISYIDGKFAKSETFNNYVAKGVASDNVHPTNKLQSKQDVDTAIASLKINEYEKTSSVNEKLENLKSELSDGSFESLVAKVMYCTDLFITSNLHLTGNIDFTKWTLFNAQFAGTGGLPETVTNGVYVLGCISNDWQDDTQAPSAEHLHKAGIALIKYVNSHPMDAKIDFSVSKVDSEYIGAISALVTKEQDTWPNLAFHLVLGTGSDGIKRLYLAVSAQGLSVSSSEYSNAEFRACGMNFIPATADGYIVPSGMLECIATTFIGNTKSGTVSFSDFSTSEVSDKNGNKVFKVVDTIDSTTGDTKHQLLIGDVGHDDIIFNQRPAALITIDGETKLVPLVVISDIKYLGIPVGTIVRWAAPSNIPDGWLDISTKRNVPATSYPELAALFGKDASGNIKLPVESNSIVKAKYFDIMNVKTAPDYVNFADFDALSKAITDEATRATAKEAELTTSIAEETTRATEAEQAIEESVSNEVLRAGEAEQSLLTKIDAETERAQAAEAAEATRATTAEEALDAKIDAADAKIEEVKDTVEAEVTRATEAEQALDAKVVAETERASGVEDVLNDAIAAEKERAETKETSLKNAVTSEAQRANAAEKLLNDRITSYHP